MNGKITFLGSGNMAEALICALIKSRAYRPSDIIASDINTQRLSFIKNKYKISIIPDNSKACKASKTVVLSVKPQVMEELLSSIAGQISKDQLVVSIAAGITTKFIEKHLAKRVPVIRVMPNTPALIGAGAAGAARGKYASKSDLKKVLNIFNAAGLAVEVQESKLNAVTAISGSGPAYIFYTAQIMEEAGVSMGLPKDIARKLASQTIFGAGYMLRENKGTPQDLREKVTSKGGTTEAAIKYLQSNKFAVVFKNAIRSARKRAGELAR